MRTWLGNAGLGLISIVVAFALVEAGLRAADFSYPSWYLTDEVAGAKLRPSVEGQYQEQEEQFPQKLGVSDPVYPEWRLSF